MKTVKTLALKKETLKTLGTAVELKPGSPGTTTNGTIPCTLCHNC